MTAHFFSCWMKASRSEPRLLMGATLVGACVLASSNAWCAEELSPKSGGSGSLVLKKQGTTLSRPEGSQEPVGHFFPGDRIVFLLEAAPAASTYQTVVHGNCERETKKKKWVILKASGWIPAPKEQPVEFTPTFYLVFLPTPPAPPDFKREFSINGVHGTNLSFVVPSEGVLLLQPTDYSQQQQAIERAKSSICQGGGLRQGPGENTADDPTDRKPLKVGFVVCRAGLPASEGNAVKACGGR